MALLFAFALATAGLVADSGGGGPQAARPPAEPKTQAPPPVFRAGANFVRVDVFAM